MKVKSKNFHESEIKGILPDGSIYLKIGVVRKRYNTHLNYDEIPHINQNLINADRLAETLNILYGSSLDEHEYSVKLLNN